MNLSFLAQIDSGQLAQQSLVLQERTFWVSLATLICLGIYTCFTLGLWRAARKQLTELIYQRKRDVLPAFNVSSETRSGKDGLRLHNIGNGAALNVSIANLHSKSNLGAGTIIEFSHLSLVKCAESEFVVMTPQHDRQSTAQVHVIDVVKPLKSYLENTGTLTIAIRFQDIDGSSYVQNVVLQEHAAEIVAAKFDRPVQVDA